MADIRPLGGENNVDFAMYLTKEIGVAVVPGSSFYCPDSPDAKRFIRFCFCKELATLEEAVERLGHLRPL